jgi:hypothetical protein
MPLLQNAALYGGAGVAISSLLDENGNPVTSEPVPEQSFYWNQMNPTAPEDGAAYGEAQLNPTYAANGGLMSLAVISPSIPLGAADVCVARGFSSMIATSFCTCSGL